MPPSFTLSDLANLVPEILSKLPVPPSVRDWLAAHTGTDPGPVLKRRVAQMPVLNVCAEQMKNEQPLKGLRVVMVLHFLHDLLYFISYCVDAGLAPGRTLILFKQYPYRNKPYIQKCLTDWGFPIAPVESLEEVLPEFCVAGSEKLLVIEDGGYVVPYFHGQEPQLLQRTIGAVEQTTKGIRRDSEAEQEAGGLQIPVLSVADSKIKGDFEPGGVARAVWENVRSLASTIMWEGRSVLVVGYGTIGRALSHRIRASNTSVIVYDKSVYQRARARIEGFDTVNSLAEGLQRPNVKLVIGATGEQSITPAEIASLPAGVYLASASSDRVEIGVDHLDAVCTSEEIGDGCRQYTFADGRKVFLLAEGYPVNFYGAESVQDQLIDLVMTQMFLAACFLAREGNRVERGIDKATVDTLSEQADLIGTFYRIHYS